MVTKQTSLKISTKMIDKQKSQKKGANKIDQYLAESN